ncbi:hypothetical protein HPB49_020181 [Dermacentor silvarum]|uniref:Uncharacterized protein n=1 Tax=Dermacentor silvarum TaxID=543639 RepID=A0ACB8CSM9_DERSI|nr:hypothetical protein HPB49_020181 [Dermacentor silvarum]
MTSTIGATIQTVFGFGTALDRIATAFVNAFPSTRMCCACGMVPSTLAILSCHHPLCRPCYDEHGQKYGHCCPVDKQPYREEDLTWMDFSSAELMARRVLCWNTPNGCGFEGEAADMVDHFQNDCRFHATTCQRCGITFRQRHMAEHRHSGCLPQRSRQEPPRTACAVTAQLEEPLKLIAESIGSMRESLEVLQHHFFRDRYNSVVVRLFQMENTLRSIECSLNNEGQSEESHPSWGFVRTHVGDIERRAGVQTRAILAQHRAALSSQIRTALDESQRTAAAVLKRECNAAAETFAQQRTRAQDVQAASSSRSRLLCEVSRKIDLFQETLSKKETVSGKDLARSMQLLAVTSLAATNDVTNVSSPLEWTASVDVTTWSVRTFTLPGPSGYFYGYLAGFLLSFDLNNAVFTPCVLQGLYDDFLTWPATLGFSIELTHPGDPANTITLRDQTKWKKAGKCSAFPNIVLEGSGITIDSSTLQDGGYIANGKLRMRFNLTR